ncbi:MAG TPA: class I SAM-dependent methyltransferase, partial [Planctomycetota bacterium]|nr:class I SAM-dependent methyltransferase [Planctomycetota bacterium]
FDPVTHDLDARIHFEFKDGTALRDAFVYRWRLWTLPDLREALEAVGFEDVHVLWEGTDPRTGSGNGAWRRVERGEACRSFVAYVVARKPAARRPSGRGRRSP